MLFGGEVYILDFGPGEEEVFGFAIHHSATIFYLMSQEQDSWTIKSDKQ